MANFYKFNYPQKHSSNELFIAPNDNSKQIFTSLYTQITTPETSTREKQLTEINKSLANSIV